MDRIVLFVFGIWIFLIPNSIRYSVFKFSQYQIVFDIRYLVISKKPNNILYSYLVQKKRYLSHSDISLCINSMFLVNAFLFIHFTLCILLLKSYFMHFTLWISLYALHYISLHVFLSMHFIICTSFYVFNFIHFTPCISLYEFHSLHFTLYISLFAFDSMNFTLCI